MAMLLAALTGLAAAPGALAQQTQVTASWGASRYVAEEGGEPAVVALRLDQAPGREVTIALNFTYSSGATAADHSSIPSRVVFGPTDTVRYLLVRAIDDALDDDGTNVFGESVLLDIRSPPSGSGVVVGDGEERTTVAFLDNDGGVPPSIPRISGAAPGDGKVVLSWGKGLPPGGDPTSFELRVENLVAFPFKIWTIRNIPGTTRSLTIGSDLPEIGEALLNGDLHRFTLQAQNLSGESIRASAVATPSATPPASVRVRWSEDDYSATEGGNDAEMLLVLGEALDRDVTVSLWRVYEGTTSPADVQFPDPLSITIPANTTQGSMTVRAVDDDLPESEEVIQFVFRQLPEGVAFDDTNPRPTTRLRLRDNDSPLTARFEHGSYEVREGGSVDVTLLLNKTNPGVLGTLNLLRENMEGASSGDLIGVPPQVTFLPDVTRLTFTLEAPYDDFGDDGERVRITLVPPIRPPSAPARRVTPRSRSSTTTTRSRCRSTSLPIRWRRAAA